MQPDAPFVIGRGVDDAGVEQSIARLVDIRVGNFELVGAAAIRQRSPQIQTPGPDRSHISKRCARGPFWRVLNLAEVCHIGRHACDVGDILVELRVDIAQRAEQVEPVAIGGDAFAKPCVEFKFDTLEGGLTRVRRHAAE